MELKEKGKFFSFGFAWLFMLALRCLLDRLVTFTTSPLQSALLAVVIVTCTILVPLVTFRTLVSITLTSWLISWLRISGLCQRSGSVFFVLEFDVLILQFLIVWPQLFELVPKLGNLLCFLSRVHHVGISHYPELVFWVTKVIWMFVVWDQSWVHDEWGQFLNLSWVRLFTTTLVESTRTTSVWFWGMFGQKWYHNWLLRL